MNERPRPRIESETAPGLAENKTARKRASLAALIEPKDAGVVPSSLRRGASAARERQRLKARSEAAKLDIMAKRRTDDEGGQPHP